MSSDALHADETLLDAFTLFVKRTDPALRRALVAAFGRDQGVEAAAETWAYAWENWDRVRSMDNPAGFLWGVGRNKARQAGRRRLRVFPAVPDELDHLVEPGLAGGLERLSERQRVAVLLKHGYGWTYAEMASLLGLSVSSLQKHVERGLTRLRRSLGVN